MPHQIHKAGVRAKLPRRREPYWERVQQGQYIGYRRMPDSDSQTWIVRARTDDGKQKYHSLGDVTDAFGFDEAKAAAIEWLKLQEHGITTDEIVTVADACKRYVEDRRKAKSESCARDAEARFERTIYDEPIGARALAKIRSVHIKAWRDGLGIGPASSNRTLIAVKAALNLAIRERNVVESQAREWRDVKPLPNAHKRRDLCLNVTQRRALLNAATGAVRDLIEAAALTGARAGELVNATRRQFDKQHGTMTFTGKTGTRTVPLSPAAVVLLSRLAESKLPAARLLTRDDGRPWAHSDWDELVRAAAAKAVVKDDNGRDVKLPAGVCLYTLRHSWITTALTAGMTTLDVARLVGTSLMMIEKHYGHLVMDAAKERLAKVQML